MAFIINRNALKVINRRTAEHLRSQDGNIKKSIRRDAVTGQIVAVAYPGQADAEITNPQTAHFSRDDIRNALMLAKKKITSNAATMRAEDEIPDALPVEPALTKKA